VAPFAAIGPAGFIDRVPWPFIATAIAIASPASQTSVNLLI